MPILELIKAGEVRVPDKVREKGDDEAGWVIVDSAYLRGSSVVIEARYEGEDFAFEWGVFDADDELEAER